MSEKQQEPMGRRERKRLARHARFLAIAMEIVEEGGIDALTMPRLADAADVAVGGLYRYFSSKENLIVDLQVLAARTFVEFLDRRLNARAFHPLARLVNISESWQAFATEAPQQFALLDGSMSSHRPLLKAEYAMTVENALAPVFEACMTSFDECTALGHFFEGDRRLRAEVLWAAVHGVGHFQKRDRFLPDQYHANAIRQELINALFMGWGASKEVLQLARSQ